VAYATDYQFYFKDAITPLALFKLTRVFREMMPHQTLEICGLEAGENDPQARTGTRGQGVGSLEDRYGL